MHKAHIAQQEREKLCMRIKPGLDHVNGNPVGRPKLTLPKDLQKLMLLINISRLFKGTKVIVDLYNQNYNYS